MRTRLLAPLLLSGAIALGTESLAAEAPPSAIAVEPLRSPFVVIGEAVSVSVGKHLSIVEGRYDFRYVRRLERGGASERCTFEYPVFAPRDADSLADLIALTQPKLHVGAVAYEPEDFALWTEFDEKPPPFLPEDMRVVLLIFRLPRAVLRDRFTLDVRYFQPHFRFGGREVSAYLPLLPDFEPFKNEFLYSRPDFTVEFQAVDAVHLRRLSVNEAVALDTPQRVKINPIHREIIAVEVAEPPQP
ncbi:MAG TPA: hypothetical protein VLW52_04970 [Opitutaceae bacterium]|nr:hypothetical protein [Opitutaceae bacterium]